MVFAAWVSMSFLAVGGSSGDVTDYWWTHTTVRRTGGRVGPRRLPSAADASRVEPNARISTASSRESCGIAVNGTRPRYSADWSAVTMTTAALAPRPTVCASADARRRRPGGRPRRRAAGARARRPGRAPTRRAARPSTAARRSGSPAAPAERRASASSFACSPGAHRPSSWYASSSRAASVSWHSTTSRSSGPMPASSYASSRGERRRRRDVGVVDAGQRCRLAEHAAGQVRAQPRRRERARRAVAGRARSTTAAAPSLGEHSIQRCSGSHTTRDASTSLGGHLLAEHRVRVVHAVAPVLHHDLGEVLLGEPGLAQQPLRAQREVRGRRGEPGLLAPRLEERRADDALGHLLDAEHEHAVVLAGADRARRELQRGAAARAAGLDVDDRHAGAARARRAPCGPTRRRRTRCRRTRPGTRVAGLGERGAHRVHAHVGVGARRRSARTGGCRRRRSRPRVTARRERPRDDRLPSRRQRRRRRACIGWPNVERGGIGLGEAGDHAQPLVRRARRRRSRTAPGPS